MSSALPLAASIATMDRAELRALVDTRRIASPESVQDPLSLALEFLRPDSLSRALQSLDRATLAALWALDSDPSIELDAVDREQLRNFGLIGVEQDAPVVLPEVGDAMRLALASSGIGVEDLQRISISDPLAAESSEPADTSGWYAPALTSVRRAAALLFAIREQPATLGRRGTVAAVSVRDLASTVHSEAEVVGKLLTLLQAAGLLVPVTVRATHHREQLLLIPSSEVANWMRLPLHERWIALANTAWKDVQGSIRTMLDRTDGDLDRAVNELLPAEFPLMPASLHLQAKQFADLARDLGLTVGGKLAPPISALVEGDDDEMHRAALRGFPEAVAGVYVQPDLSVIIPGPLSPQDEHELSSIAEAEHWGVAVTLRITPASLQKATRQGQHPEQIRALLERLSLTGIPQPLDYLLSDIQRNNEFAQKTPEHAAPRVTPAEAFAIEASAAAEQRADEKVQASFDAAASAEPEEDPLISLIERVHSAARSAPGSGDLSRRLELAIRDRSPVRVTAAAGGQERSFVLLPVSLNAGRLRATDQGAGVQRTIPLTAIVSVEVA